MDQRWGGTLVCDKTGTVLFNAAPAFSSKRESTARAEAVRPWLLERAAERLQELDRPDASDDEIIDFIMLRNDLELAQELHW
jgi:hypothetical protein